MTDDDGIHELDIGKVITTEFDDTQWLIEPIIPAHRSVALYAVGKTGKSLLVLDFVAAAASGRPILGDAPLETPIHILYLDQEMTQPDLQERLHSLGYEQPDSTLAQHLHYYQLSPWPPLDSAAGGQRLLEEVHKTKAQLVVIDTLIRTVEGEENSADTIKNFNRYTAVPLKAAGIALLRIDHAGKDLTRGQRGTSAKRDDVDVVWLLKPEPGELPGRTMLTLQREAARIEWVQQDIHITRHEGPPLRHSTPSFHLSSEDIEIVRYLQDQGLERHNISVRSGRDALNQSPLTAKTQRLMHIVKWVRQHSDDHSESGVHVGVHTLSDIGVHAGVHDHEKGNAQVSEGERAGYKKKLGEQGTVHPQIPSKKTASQSHGEILWVTAPATPEPARNTTSPHNSQAPAKSLAAATQDPTCHR